MLKKRMFKKGWPLVIVVAIALCVYLPVMAQEKILEDPLEEANTALAGQTWVIEQLTDNLFNATEELMEEIDSLNAFNCEQTETIKKITDNFFKVNGKLKPINAQLEQKVAKRADETIRKITQNWFELAVAEQKQIGTINKTTDNFFKVTGELNNKMRFLKAVYEAEVVFFGGVHHDFWKRLNKSLKKEVIKLPAFLNQKSRSPTFFFSPEI